MGVLSCVGAVPGGKPFEPFGKDSDQLRRRKHGTTDRLALPHQHRPKGEIAETVRSAPGRDPRMARFIRVLGAMAREREGKGEGKASQSKPALQHLPVAGNRWRLDTMGPCGVFRHNFRDFRDVQGRRR
jgi:hypothetical protein